MPQTWLEVVAWCALASGFVSAGWLAWDISVRRYRPDMAIMGVVWPVTALYFGPLAVWGYLRFGRPYTDRWRQQHGQAPRRAPWASVAVGVSHCGAGCTLGDVIAEFLVFGAGWTIAGRALWAQYICDFLAALVLGIFFQYLAIAAMRGPGLRAGLKAAAKADVLSLSAFEVGLFSWMAVMTFVLFPDPHLTPTSPVYWFLMQIGMVIGFFTAWPANVWLIRRGIKHAM